MEFWITIILAKTKNKILSFTSTKSNSFEPQFLLPTQDSYNQEHDLSSNNDELETNPASLSEGGLGGETLASTLMLLSPSSFPLRRRRMPVGKSLTGGWWPPGTLLGLISTGGGAVLTQWRWRVVGMGSSQGRWRWECLASGGACKANIPSVPLYS